MRSALLCLLPTLLGGSTAAAGVLINEFMPDPPGGDGGNEWVELCNDGASSVDISGWELERATSSFGSRFTFPGGTTLSPGAYIVVGEDLVTGADFTVASGALGLGNAGSSGDAVRIVDESGGVIDVVVYGPDNSDGFLDESGSLVSSIAPKPGSGQTARRSPDCHDTNANGSDFQTGDPTLGAPNPSPAVCDPGDGRIKINEFLTDPAGSDGDAGLEFVELYNPSGTASLEGWTLQVQTSSSPSVKWTIGSGESIGGSDFYVVGDSNVSGRDAGPEAGSTLGLPNGSGADAILLVDCEGSVVDTVVYGTDNSEDQIVDDTGSVAFSLAPKPGSGQAVARKNDGVDTDLSGDDFAIHDSPSAGSPNPQPPPCTLSSDLVINELLTDPGGTDGDAGTEFIELYNRGSGALDLGGWSLIAAGQEDDTTADVILPEGSNIAGEGWFVIGNWSVAESNYVVEFALPNGSGGDGLRLLDCEGTLVDVVVYGDDNEDGITDESGEVADPAPKPGSDQALARIEDGVDSDSRDDWFLDVSPTPGDTNYQPPPDIPDDTDDGRGGGCNPDAAPGQDAPNGQGCSTAPARGSLLGLIALLMMRRRRE